MYSFRLVIQAIRSGRTAAASWIERAAFGALLALAFSFAVDAVRTPILIGELLFTNLEILQFLVLSLWLAYHLLEVESNERRPVRARGFAMSIALWLVVLGVSTFLAPGHLDEALTFDSRIARGVVLAWATYDLVRTGERWKMLLRCLALGGIVVSVVGLAEVANIAPVQTWLEDLRGTSIRVGELLRLSSTLTYPNIAAIVIELTLFPLLAWILATRRRWLRLGLSLGLLADLMALVLTYSRGGLIAFALSLVLIAGLALYYRDYRDQGQQRRRLMVGAAVLMASLAVVAVLMMLSNPVVALRFVTEDDQSWYRAAFVVTDQILAQPGQTITIPVKLSNQGRLTWQAQTFHLSYHLASLSPETRVGLQYEGQRTPLPHDVTPGQSVSVEATVISPPEAGHFVIEWDMVQDGVTWFSAKSDSAAETRLSLDGEPVSSPVPFDPVPFDDVPPTRALSRLTLWKIALQMVRAYPLFGVGPDNFRQTYGTYLGEIDWDRNIHANNLYFEWAADTGILGLLAFLLMSVMLAHTAWRGLKLHRGDSGWLWQLALIGCLLAWYLHGTVDFFYEFMPVNTVFWILVGLTVSALREDHGTAPVQRPNGSGDSAPPT